MPRRAVRAPAARAEVSRSRPRGRWYCGSVAEDEEADSRLADASRRADELQALLDALPLATGVRDREGNYLYINAAGSAGYGARPEALIGGNERALLPPG